MEPLTLARATACIDHLAALHHARIANKEDAEMKIVAHAFDLVRVLAPAAAIPSGDDFLTLYATTVVWMVSLPRAVREDPEALLEVGVHEIQHVHQWWTGGEQIELGAGYVNMMALYLVHPEARVRYEVEAMRTTYELRHARGLPMPAPAYFAEQLRCAYAISAPLAAHAERLLEGAETEASHGLVVTRAGRDAISWLRAAGVVS